MGRTQCADDFPRSGGKVVSRTERLGARSKTAYRESGTNRFNPTPIAPGKPPNRTRRRPCFLRSRVSNPGNYRANRHYPWDQRLFKKNEQAVVGSVTAISRFAVSGLGKCLLLHR